MRRRIAQRPTASLLPPLSGDPRTAGIRILLLSAGASLDDVARGLAAGADAYLAKPFRVAGLVHQVQSLMAGQPA